MDGCYAITITHQTLAGLRCLPLGSAVALLHAPRVNIKSKEAYFSSFNLTTHKLLLISAKKWATKL